MKPLTKAVAIRKGGLAAQLNPEHRAVKAAADLNAATPPVLQKLIDEAEAKSTKRYAKWRAANPELYLERQRAAQKRYRDKRRAADKAKREGK